MRYTLNGTWELSFSMPGDGRRVEIPATVPGNVELAMEEQGILADCMPADNAHAASAFEQIDDWTYIRRFDAPNFEAGWTQELVFEGIDTIAEIYLNGEKQYDAQDMFMTHRIDIRKNLLAKGNTLKVVLRSAMLWARKQQYDILAVSREHTCYAGQPYLRKARHEWGWDNAPRLLTSGIYRDVYLESLPPERFDEVYLYTARVKEETVDLGMVWNFVTPRVDLSAYRLRCTLSYQGKTAYETEMPVDFPRGALRFSVPRNKIALWWPRGFGDANLCDVALEMYNGTERISLWTSKWGIRTLRLERSEDILPNGDGEFVFIANNQRVYINGTNWKPLDALHSRADAKVDRALELVLDLNCNMVRIWGGGIYEDHPFFDFCDRNGIMVWQDFMFGCEFPPVDAWYQEAVARETRQIVEKLRNHPSLAVWCGDNEDDECLTWTHGDSTILPSDNKISRWTLRECVLRYDPYRSYVESSPYASDANICDRRAGNVSHIQPEAHLYPATKHFGESLRACKSLFIGETGPIAINAMTDNPRIFAREQARATRLWNTPIDPSRMTNALHQWDDYFCTWRQTGRELCENWYGQDFPVSQWQDYCLAVNIICADVFKDVIEYCRTERWRKTGVIWWSLVDMWPMLFNYSVVDSDFHKKLPYFWIRQSQQFFALMIVRKECGGEAALYAANDTLCRHQGDYSIQAIAADGSQRTVAIGCYDESANSSRLLQQLPERNGQELWIIEWTEDGRRFYNHFVTGAKPYDFAAWRAWTAHLAKLYGMKD